MVDLIDDFNQRQIFGSRYPKDRVSGYTIRQVEDALNNGRTWNQLKENLRNRYNNPTEEYLNELFDQYNSIML